jgi:O-antigen/teichoic acid export membrane protein
VILVLVAGRVVTGVVYLWFCLRGVPGMRQGALLNSADCRDLLTSGSWMTVSNVASPIMVYLDRFLISSMLSVTLVAYYTTPFEVVTKLWIVPLAITSVLFPAFAAFFATDQAKLNETYARGLRNSLSLVFPAIFLLVLFAPEGLRLWLGPVFQRDSTWVLRWIAVGVLLNSVGQVPFALLQAVDRPDITAKLHLCELPVYVIAVVLGIHFFGLGGAAVAWSLRLGIETLVLLMLAQRVVTHEALKRNFLLGLILAIGVLGLACLPMPATGKFLLATCVLGCFATFVWRRLLEANEKNHLKLWVERLAWSGMPISSRR